MNPKDQGIVPAPSGKEARSLDAFQADQITAALVKAQAAIASVKMDKENPHFRSKYASLAAIREAIQKPLADNGLAVTQSFRIEGENLVLVTTLRHISGQTITSEYPMHQGTPQQMGSAATYARRYSLSALLSLASEDDDDGEGIEKEFRGKDSPAKPIRTLRAEAIATKADLLQEAEKVASKGLLAVQSWWKELPLASQKILEPHIDNLKIMAKEADAEHSHIKGDLRNAG